MELKLYMFETCPFCRKVLNEIESSGRTDVELHNIQERARPYGAHQRRRQAAGAMPFHRRQANVRERRHRGMAPRKSTAGIRS